MYFNISVFALINLMQEAYHSDTKTLNKDIRTERIHAHIGVWHALLTFCGRYVTPCIQSSPEPTAVGGG